MRVTLRDVVAKAKAEEQMALELLRDHEKPSFLSACFEAAKARMGWIRALVMLLSACATSHEPELEWCLVPAPGVAPYCYATRADCEDEYITYADPRSSVCFARAIGTDASL